MPFFLEFTQENGEPLDIPAFSIVIVEELDAATKEEHPEAHSGLFFDLGNGLQSQLLRDRYGKVGPMIRDNNEGRFLELTNEAGGRMSILKENVVGLRGLPASDEKDAPHTLVTNRVGNQLLNFNVRDTRDQIREKLNG